MTPSKRRREGRKAFFEGGDPLKECPIHNNLWGRDEWIEGWCQKLADFNAKQVEQEEKDNDWIRNQIRNANNFDELKEALLEMYDTM